MAWLAGFVGLAVAGLTSTDTLTAQTGMHARGVVPHGDAPIAGTHGEPRDIDAAQPAARPIPHLVSANPGRTVWVPERCESSDEPLDLLLHFHGVPELVTGAVEEAEVNAVVGITNEGALSDSYRNAWSGENAFERLLLDAQAWVEHKCKQQRKRRAVKFRRIALSSFSAGFAAVQQLLDKEAVARRVDAVLLADSLYAAYIPNTNQLSERGLAPFVGFARKSLRRQKLFAMTHSEVPTDGYASTRETADYLLKQLGLERTPVEHGSATAAEAGAFWLYGLPGADASAHADHLQQMGRTLLPRLANRWNRPSRKH